MKSERTHRAVHKLLLVIDAMDPSQEACETALRLASQLEIPIVAAFVVDMTAISFLGDRHIFVQEEIDELLEDFDYQAKVFFETLCKRAEKGGVPLETLRVKGRFYQCINDCLKRYECDGAVIGNWEKIVGKHDACSIERQLVLSQVEVPIMLVR